MTAEIERYFETLFANYHDPAGSPTDLRIELRCLLSSAQKAEEEKIRVSGVGCRVSECSIPNTQYPIPSPLLVPSSPRPRECGFR